MINILKIKKSAWIAFFVALVVTFIMSSAAYAQAENPEEIAKKYGVTFPIEELGGCKDYSSCRSFCEDPVNSESCISFAKSKGFYKQEQENVKKEELINKAKAVLGCDSQESCKNFCQVASNFEKCDAFAKQNNLTGGHVNNPEEKRILEKAKEILGCDSPTTCAAFCSDESNRDKCSQFASKTGLKGGERGVGPGGCTSEETCKAFCSEPSNFKICSGFAQSAGSEFKGPGGCNSEESCKSFCQSNEIECKSYFKGRREDGVRPNYDPQEMCNKTPRCFWSNNTCNCSSEGDVRSGEEKAKIEEYSKICRDNPEKCKPTNYNQTGPGSYSVNTMSRDQQEATCKAGGGSCDWSSGVCNCRGYRSSSGGTTGGSATTDPATGCKNAGGSWNGSYCQMPNTTTNNTQTTAPSGMSRESQESGCRSCGGTCNWNGDMCNCQCGSSSTNTPSPTTTQTAPSEPAPAPVQESQPSTQTTEQPVPPTTEPAPAPAVKGISYEQGLLKFFLSLFK